LSDRVGVLGSGSWGTALAVHLARSGARVLLWARSPELAATLSETRRNEHYLPGVDLPAEIEVVHDLQHVAPCRTVLVAVPSHGFRSVVHGLFAVGGHHELAVVSATKGIEGESLARMSEVTFEEAVRARRRATFAIVSGPTFAEELVAGSPTAAVVASENTALSRSLQGTLSVGNLRLYSTTDVVGVELGGAVKNVIAIAAGVVHGLGFGHNTSAALITRGLHEMTRLGVANGGRARTFSGLAGLGDLVLTCTGSLSRNRRTGEALAAGRKLGEIEAEMGMVAEGVRNSRTVLALSRRRGVEMPIVEQMERVLYEGLAPDAAVASLMARDLKSETEL
jgi:glycerol-3-phosphate dehydrogenase (NAD(P)+)